MLRIRYPLSIVALIEMASGFQSSFRGTTANLASQEYLRGQPLQLPTIASVPAVITQRHRHLRAVLQRSPGKGCRFNFHYVTRTVLKNVHCDRTYSFTLIDSQVTARIPECQEPKAMVLPVAICKQRLQFRWPQVARSELQSALKTLSFC